MALLFEVDRRASESELDELSLMLTLPLVQELSDDVYACRGGGAGACLGLL